MIDLGYMKKSLAPTELRKKRKPARQAEEEKIDLMGSETESEGRKATQKIMEEEKKKQKKKEEDELNMLDLRRRTVFSYRELLMISLHQLVLNIQMPNTYSWGVWFDGKGIILKIVDKKKQTHVRAFRQSNDPVHDRNAIRTLAVWAEDIFDKCEGKLESDIWTPHQ